MDVSHVGEIPHSCCNAPQHSHQLDDCELTIMFLKKKKSDILAEGSEGHKSGAAPTQDFFFFPTCRHYAISASLFALKFVLTLRNSSNEPFSMYSMTIMTGFPGGEIKAEQ